MHKSYFIAFLLLVSCSHLALAQQEKLLRMMDHYAAHDHFNGTVLVVRHGAVLLSKGYGYRDAARKIKNNENTIYQIGSNTRQFTAEVILQLDSKGKLGLEDRLAKYLPGFPNGDKITLRNLLTHSSGIANYTTDPSFRIPNADRPIVKDELVGRFKNLPLAFTPGSAFEYSNSDYYLLGMVIEKITAKKFERELREDILFTCDMTHSGCNFARLNDANKAIGYNLTDGDHFTEAVVVDSTISYAAGSMYSTASDLLKWHRALLHHRLLPKDWQDLAFTPHKNQYALGWNINNSFNRKFMVHAGAISGFTSYEVRQEDDDIFIVLLENVVRDGESQAVIANNIVQCLYDKNYQLPWERKEQPAVSKKIATAPKPTEAAGKPEHAATTAPVVSAAVLRKYQGVFEINPAFTLTFTLVGDELFAATPENKSIRMVPETATLFRTEGLNAEIEFIKSATGAINKIVLHQQGQLIPGVRAK
jgi:CubicO group peptidase (beta-lactamase class C family)